MKHFLMYAACMIFLVGSCRAPKELAYFQGIENLTEEDKAAMNQQYIPRICIDDALIIFVTGPDKASVAHFSPPPFAYYMPGEADIGISATTQNLFTYLVDEKGEINFPVLGHIRVAGMSINETVRMLEGEIRKTAPKAVVSVQIANFKVGIMGEVTKPDIYPIRTPRISILELIALAGDMTILGDRKDVWLTRDNDGEKIHVHLDLTDPAIFASPYYYLQQNDMVYVRPNAAQKRNAEFSTRDNVRITLYSAVVTSVSMLVSWILTIRGQNR